MSDTRSAFEFQAPETSETIPQLLRQLAEQGTHLAQQHASLVQAEVKASVDELKLGAGAMAGAAVVGLAALGVLLMGLSFLLAEVMKLWAATLIVAAVALGVAFLLFRQGSKKMQDASLTAERTKRTLERAPGAIAAHANGGSAHD